jgi:hypothetical protein
MKKIILDTISDLCSDFLYYDRKEDEKLSVNQLNAAVKNGDVTIDEMVAEFRKNLEDSFSSMIDKEGLEKRMTKQQFIDQYIKNREVKNMRDSLSDLYDQMIGELPSNP